MPTRDQIRRSLNLSEDLIPTSSSNRPGTTISGSHITIHNTDNSNRGADALAHARYLKGADARQRKVSWHYTVDDKRCINHLPIEEMGWHAGSRTGNSSSIGIEICMNSGIDQQEADRRAATLSAVLMYDLGIPIDKVVQHHHWTGKNCPRLLRDRTGAAWRDFIEQVDDIYQSIDRPSTHAASRKSQVDSDELDLAEIFPSGDSTFEAWAASHAEQGEVSLPALCSLPEVPERLLAEGIDPHRKSFVLMHGKRWANNTVLHFHFLAEPRAWRGAEDQKQAVRNAFQEWKSQGVGLQFEETSDAAEAEIRIGFEGGRVGSWSYVGRDSIDYAKDPKTRTMNFGWDLTTEYGHDTALHEIGHAFGLEHEHQNPWAGIVWDEQAVLDHFKASDGWDPPEVRRNILDKVSADESEGGDWDPDSIMHYRFEAGLILKPERYRTKPLIPAPNLSDEDIRQVRRIYPDAAPAYAELEPFRSMPIGIKPGEQLDFVIRPSSSRDYTLQTIGAMDTVLVLFEVIDGKPRYMDGDDDGGLDRNALIRPRLVKGRTYHARLRLYYAERSGEGAILLW